MVAGCVLAASNVGVVNSTGDQNQATVQQAGNDNSVFVTQGDPVLLVNNNAAEIFQQGTLNLAAIQQMSCINEFTLIQLGADNELSAIQANGPGNIVNLTQEGGAKAIICQDGAGNLVKGLGTDEMGRSLNGSTLDLKQFGSGNVLELYQTNGASAIVTQDGMTNKVTIIQN